MEIKHTPGPWSRNIPPASKYPTIFACQNTHVAMVISKGLTAEEIEANANLIAAAPDLLESLKGIIDDFCSEFCSHGSHDDYCTKAKKAIARAEGKQNTKEF